MVLYRIEAAMDQSLGLAEVLVKACEQLAELLENMRGYKNLDQYWVEYTGLRTTGIGCSVKPSPPCSPGAATRWW
jgi:hypothetical protein